jgi:hypothetical protein
MTYDAFISYRRDGSASQARLIKSELTNRGYQVFLDVADLDKGHFDDKLLTTIAETPASSSSWRRARSTMRERGRDCGASQAGDGDQAHIVPVCCRACFRRRFRLTSPSWHDTAVNIHAFDATIEKLKASGKPSAARPHARRDRRHGFDSRDVTALSAATAPPPPPVDLRAASHHALNRCAPSRHGSSREGPNHRHRIPQVASDGRSSPPGRRCAAGERRGPNRQAGRARGSRPRALHARLSLSPHARRLHRRLQAALSRPRSFRRSDHRHPLRDLAVPRHLPLLRATIANNAPQQVLITSVVIDIAKSDLKREVVLTVDDGSTNTIVLVNHGWGDVEDAKLTFTIADPVRSPPFVSARARSRSAPSAPEGILDRRACAAWSSATPISRRSQVPWIWVGWPTPDLACDHRDCARPMESRRCRARPTTCSSLPASGRIVADLPTAHQIKPGE